MKMDEKVGFYDKVDSNKSWARCPGGHPVVKRKGEKRSLHGRYGEEVCHDHPFDFGNRSLEGVVVFANPVIQQ